MNYTNFIKALKYFFIILSTSLLMLVIINNNPRNLDIGQDFKKNEKGDFSSINQTLTLPVFVGLDENKRPFKISAEKATRYNNNSDILELDKPHGEIETNEEKFFMKGKSGIFRKSQQVLEIEGDVEFTNKSSMIFNTSSAKFDFEKEILSGNKKVKGKQNNSLIFSEGFKILNKENKIIFTGKSKLKILK